MSTSLACKAGQAKFEDELVGGESAQVEYSLQINEPQYGAFYQEGPVPVSGVVEPFTAEVYLQGSPVAVNEDGSFTSALAFQKDYAVVDVTVPEGDLRERIPVFAGNDPSDTWPEVVSCCFADETAVALSDLSCIMLLLSDSLNILQNP